MLTNSKKILFLIMLFASFCFGQKTFRELPQAHSLQDNDVFVISHRNSITNKDTTKHILYSDFTTILEDSIGTITRYFIETIYSATEPTTRQDGSALKQGDLWIDTDDYNHIYVYQTSTHDFVDASQVANYNRLGNLPNFLTPPNSDPGIFINDTHLGYYNGTTWNAYIDYLGRFYFGNGSDKYISWNLTNLDVRGRLNADDIYTGKIKSILLSADSIKVGTLTTALSNSNGFGQIVTINNGIISFTDNGYDVGSISGSRDALGDLRSLNLNLGGGSNAHIYINGQEVATEAWVSSQGYLTVETDPDFAASAAAGIDSSDISNWNGKSVVTLGSSGSYGQSSFTSISYQNITINGVTISVITDLN